MAATNRSTSRKALAVLLEAALVGTGLPVQAVYNHQVGDFGGRSPTTTVSSGGSQRELFAVSSDDWDNNFYLNIHTFVLYAQPSNVNWTEAHAEDALDDIECLVADVIMTNKDNAAWDMIKFAGRSTRTSVDIGGDEYIMEATPVQVEKFD